MNNTYVHIHARMNTHLPAKIRSWAHAHKCIHARKQSTHPYYHIHMMYIPHTHASTRAFLDIPYPALLEDLHIRLVAGARRSNCGSTSFDMPLSHDVDGDATTICTEAHVRSPIPTKKTQFLNGWECAMSDAVSHCVRAYHLSPVNLSPKSPNLDKIATETLFDGNGSHTHPEQHIKNIDDRMQAKVA